MNRPLSEADRTRLQHNLDEVHERLRGAERRGERPTGSAKLLAVVKRIPNPVVEALVELGHRDLAENRVQSLRDRPEQLQERAAFHLIGHLQTNKARPALTAFHSFHGLDSLRLARRLSEEATRLDREWPVYLQVNVGREPQKHGCPPEELEPFVLGVRELPGLRVMGLMAMAPYFEDPAHTRPFFDELRRRSEDLRQRGVLADDATGLSMGMSGDFEVAAECGATIVRVGSALFQGILAREEGPG